MAKKRHHSDVMAYAKSGTDPRREEYVMIREDHTAPANLPREVVMKEWPRGGNYTPESLEDGIDSVDRQMNRDDAMKMKLFGPRKV